MLQITPIKAFTDNYIWLLSEPGNSNAVVVDPGEHTGVIKTLDELGLNLTSILLTHHHWDHTGGVKHLIKHYGKLNVYGPAHSHIDTINCPLQESDLIRLDEFPITFKILEIPGHTLDHIAFYSEHDILFCGDTLFTGGCGRLFEGTPAQMVDSLSKIMALPDQTKIYCGHEYTQANLKFAKAVEPENAQLQDRIEQVDKLRAKQLNTVPETLEMEKATNPFLRFMQDDVKHAAENFADQSLEDSIEVFANIRRWKDSF